MIEIIKSTVVLKILVLSIVEVRSNQTCILFDWETKIIKSSKSLQPALGIYLPSSSYSFDS